MAFGGTLTESALRAGSSPSFAQLAAWTPFLSGGALVNVGYCVFRLIRKKSYLRYAERGTALHWLGGVLAAALWLGSALLYGAAVNQTGPVGAAFAWPAYMSLIVIGSSAAGLMAGEWQNASRQSILLMSGAVATLVIAVFVITCAPRF
jgi:L-rhamnose-H+ transport protein